MTFASRTAGLTYPKYAEACAQAVRNVLREDLKVVAARRNENIVRVAKWDAGKAQESKFIRPQKD